MNKDTHKSSSKFMLHLSADERKKLKLIAVKQGTSMNSLVKYLLQTNKSLDELNNL